MAEEVPKGLERPKSELRASDSSVAREGPQRDGVGSSAPNAYVRFVAEAPDWDKSDATDGGLVIGIVNVGSFGPILLMGKCTDHDFPPFLWWIFGGLLVLLLWSLGWRWLRLRRVRSYFGPIEILRTSKFVSMQPFEVIIQQHMRRSLNITRVELSLSWLAEYEGQTKASGEQPRPALARKCLWSWRHTIATNVSIAAGGLLEGRHQFTMPNLEALQREADEAFAARKAKPDTWLDEKTTYSHQDLKWCLEVKVFPTHRSSSSYCWSLVLRNCGPGQ